MELDFPFPNLYRSYGNTWPEQSASDVALGLRRIKRTPETLMRWFHNINYAMDVDTFPTFARIMSDKTGKLMEKVTLRCHFVLPNGLLVSWLRACVVVATVLCVFVHMWTRMWWFGRGDVSAPRSLLQRSEPFSHLTEDVSVAKRHHRATRTWISNPRSGRVVVSQLAHA